MLSKATLILWISAAFKLCQENAVPNIKQATEILLTKIYTLTVLNL